MSTQVNISEAETQQVSALVRRVNKVDISVEEVEMSDVGVNVSESGTEEVVVTRSRDADEEEKQLKATHRRTSVLEEESPIRNAECVNPFVNVHRRAVSECIIDENDNRTTFTAKDAKSKDKKKKKLSFNNIFGKKDKTKTKDVSKEEEETHDNLPQLPVFFSNTLGKSKKYASAMELHQKNHSLHRTPSFIKKLVHIGEDSSSFLKRSLSFRDFTKKAKDNSREKLTERKTQEWRQSLQSLVENDISVSYSDLSFVNYDALNDINYEPANLKAGTGDSRNSYIGRTQSMIEVSIVICFICVLIFVLLEYK
ncbi:unnamed protein product [Acanthoscelides obtectus]|uniref:Uncharacterized protein n=1 Tax=Acanthoscelides obtectus TaxID=200917 RepID=A0A9P0PD04_ACAOB|nr:unnamed protein product [Acanthoscelides obtectus]CAK1677364.1 hypothetical protein AOBTE_LOCUS31272 [Acanthoscelides obtectus]